MLVPTGDVLRELCDEVGGRKCDRFSLPRLKLDPIVCVVKLTERHWDSEGIRESTKKRFFVLWMKRLARMNVKAAMRPAHEIGGGVIGEYFGLIKLRDQHKAKDLGHLGNIPVPTRLKSEMLGVGNVESPVGGQDVEMTLPIELIAVGLNQGDQGAARLLIAISATEHQVECLLCGLC
jgi:hypothetical protein